MNAVSLCEASSASSSQGEPPAKRSRQCHRWQDCWSKYRLKQSKRGSTYAYCTVCHCDFSVGGGGVHDVKRHCSSLRHMRLLKETDGQPSISCVFNSRDQSFSEQVMVTELYFTSIIVEHNLPFASAGHFTTSVN